MKCEKEKRVKGILTAVVFFLAVITVSMGLHTSRSSAKVTVKKVTAKSNLGTKKVYVAKGKSVRLTASVSVKPNKKKNKKLKYKSASKKIARVSKKGVIKGVKAGKTKVTVYAAKNKKKKAVIKVTVMKKAVKKIGISRGSAALKPGGRLSLKASIKAPKGASKRVIWSTSNKKAATVTQKGLVTAKATGSAKITVAAADGSGKKASCTVTVKKAGIRLSSLSVYNPGNEDTINALQFGLSGARVLKAQDLTVRARRYTDGIWKTIPVRSIYTADNKNYWIDFSTEVENGYYISLTVNPLTENKAITLLCKAGGKESQTLLSGVVGDTYSMNRTVIFPNMLGNVTSKIVSGKLPAGLSYEPYRHRIVGTAKAVANNQRVVIQGTDEKKTISKRYMDFLIGSSSVICAESKTIGDKSYNRQEEGKTLYERVDVVGGSGSYQVSLLNDYSGAFYLNSDTCQAGTGVRLNGKNLKAGTYTVKIKFTDAEFSGLSAVGTVRIIVSKVYEVTINRTNVVESNYPYLYFENEGTGTVYSDSRISLEKTGVLLPAGNYCIYCSFSGERYIIKRHQKVAGNLTITCRLPGYYKVSGKVLEKSGIAYKDNGEVQAYRRNEYGQYASSGDSSQDYSSINVSAGTYELFLPNGSYKLVIKDGQNNEYETYVTVSNKGLTKNFTVNAVARKRYKISGHIYMPDGTTPNNDSMRVNLYTVDEAGVERLETTAYCTDEFLFNSKPEGRYRLKLRDTDGNLLGEPEVFTLNGDKVINFTRP